MDRSDILTKCNYAYDENLLIQARDLLGDADMGTVFDHKRHGVINLIANAYELSWVTALTLILSTPTADHPLEDEPATNLETDVNKVAYDLFQDQALANPSVKWGVTELAAHLQGIDHEEALNRIYACAPVTDVYTTTYLIIFDRSNKKWRETPEYNIMYLRQNERYLSGKFEHQGHLFVNEVLESLGMPKTSTGQTHGWILGTHEFDLGLTDTALWNAPNTEIRLEFKVTPDVHKMI